MMGSGFFVYLCLVRILSKKFSVFIAVLLWFAMSFQTVHVYSHSIENAEHEALHNNQHHDKCFVCDFTFSPYFLPDAVIFQPSIWDFNKADYLFSTNDYRQLVEFYYPLRGPPILG